MKKQRAIAALKLDIQKAQSFMEDELSEIETKIGSEPVNAAKNRTFELYPTKETLEIIDDCQEVMGSNRQDISQIDSNLYLSSKHFNIASFLF